MIKIHLGDIGTNLQITITDNGAAVDISSSTTKQIFLKKPDGTVITKDADYVTNGSDGKIKYTTQSGDINQIGLWSIQAYVVLTGGTTFRTEIENLEVLCNLA